MIQNITIVVYDTSFKNTLKKFMLLHNLPGCIKVLIELLYIVGKCKDEKFEKRRSLFKTFAKYRDMQVMVERLLRSRS